MLLGPDQRVGDSGSPSLSRKFLKRRGEMFTSRRPAFTVPSAVFTDASAFVERWKSAHRTAQREAIRAAAVFQARPNGSRVNAATRDCQQLRSPHLLNKWRDPSKKAQHALTDDHSGGERYVYMGVCDRTSSRVCARLSCRRERRFGVLWRVCCVVAFHLTPTFSCRHFSRLIHLLGRWCGWWCFQGFFLT